MPQLVARARDRRRREPEHLPVLTREVVELLRCRPGRTYVDATVGPGGHSEAILEATAPDGRVLGFDLDPDAIERARPASHPPATGSSPSGRTSAGSTKFSPNAGPGPWTASWPTWASPRSR